MVSGRAGARREHDAFFALFWRAAFEPPSADLSRAQDLVQQPCIPTAQESQKIRARGLADEARATGMAKGVANTGDLYHHPISAYPGPIRELFAPRGSS